MNGRDRRGRFTAGNSYARQGGQARAKRLTAARRRQIARAGWAGLVANRFAGDAAAARAWLGELGRHTYARQAIGGTVFEYRLETIWPHPGSPEEFADRRRQALAFGLADVDAIEF